MARKRDIPFGPQFSPEQTPLPNLLALLERYAGSYDDLVQGIRAAFFEKGTGGSYNKTKKADNTTLALRDYGILDEDKATPTAFGKALCDLRKRPNALYDEFARHILLNCNGLVFVRAVEDLGAAGEPITLETLPRALAQRGLHVPPTSTHLSAMKGWLRMAGVFTGGKTSYEVDADKVEVLLGGLGAKELDAIADLDPLQRAFLKALARFPKDEWSKSNEVAKLAESLYGVRFPWKGLPSRVLGACADAGFITFKKTTAGRGAKPHLVRPTPRFQADVVLPLLEQHGDRLGSRLRDLLRTPLRAVVKDLTHRDRNVKGRALELLALYLMFTLDLEFVDWRKRGRETGGAEVDIIVEGARLVFSRWQIQCKNSGATLEDVAKEVGLTHHLHSNVILVLSTKTFSKEAKGFADSVMRTSNIQIILLDRSHVSEITESPARLVEILHSQARHAMAIKRLPLAEAAAGGSDRPGRAKVTAR